MLEWQHRVGVDCNNDAWCLVDLSTGKDMIGIRFSKHASARQNKKLRDKIKQLYERYYLTVKFENLQF